MNHTQHTDVNTKNIKNIDNQDAQDTLPHYDIDVNNLSSDMHNLLQSIDAENNQKLASESEIPEVPETMQANTTATNFTVDVLPKRNYARWFMLGTAGLIAGAVGVNTMLTAAQNKPSAAMDIAQVNTNIVDKGKIAVVDDEEKRKRDTLIQAQAQESLAKNGTYLADIYTHQPNTQVAPPPQQQMPPPPAMYYAPNYAPPPAPSVQVVTAPSVEPMSEEERKLEENIKKGMLGQIVQASNINPSGYSQANYASSNARGADTAAAAGSLLGAGNNNDKANDKNNDKNNINNGKNTGTAGTGSTSNPSNKAPLFKAGDILYATLINGVNTDDGFNVMATIYGGAYDQATLLGTVQMQNKNISIQFNMLSPKDRNLKSLPIQAMAIREEDARQGVAESTDNHTFARYSYLFAASMLKAFGKAAQGASRTTVGLGGAMVTEQEKVTDTREIAKQGLGEVGTTLSGEVKRHFNQPPTYTIPAGQGIGVVFTQDITNPI
jgi:intracellular multiplication protein IcmE